MKICKKCKKNKDLVSFSKRKDHKDGLSTWCRTCHNKYRADRFKTDLEYRQRKRMTEQLRKFDLTKEQYVLLYEKQAGRCAVCRKLESKTRALAIDHCHKTGKVRGLLCGNCNTGLGLLNDSIETIDNLKAYLKSTTAAFIIINP